MKTLEEIKASIKAGDRPKKENIEALTEYLAANPQSDEAYLSRGMLNWSMGQRAAAINDLNAALRINPDSEAKTMLVQVNSILDFYDKDRYNP